MFVLLSLSILEAYPVWNMGLCPATATDWFAALYSYPVCHLLCLDYLVGTYRAEFQRLTALPATEKPSRE